MLFFEDEVRPPPPPVGEPETHPCEERLSVELEHATFSAFVIVIVAIDDGERLIDQHFGEVVYVVKTHSWRTGCPHNSPTATDPVTWSSILDRFVAVLFIFDLVVGHVVLPISELGHLLVFRQGFLVYDSLWGLPFFFWQFQRNRNVGVRVGFYDVGMWLR